MRKKVLYTLIGAAVLFTTSCDKRQLSPVPQTVISDLSAFDTRVRIEGQVRAIYASIKNSGMYGGRYQIFNDIRGGDFLNERTNVVTGFDVWSYTTVGSSTNSILNHWAQAYYVINLANVFLDGMDAKGAGVVGAAVANNFRGEARLLRAMSYYSLLQLYARPYWDGNGSKPGVPLRLKGNTGSGDYALARATVAEVYNQILEDLNFAEANLPLTNGNATANTTRAHRNTAIALKTRVYLNMGQWTNVITEGNKLVPTAAPWRAPSGVANELLPNYGTIFTNYTNSEMILSMPFTALDVPGTQNGLGWYYNPGPNGGGEFALNTTAPGIAANTGWRTSDARRNFLVVSGGQTWLSKWPNPNNAADPSPVIRYAEVMLNLAEALARNAAGTSVDARALAILNAVRKRADPTITDFAPADKNALIDLILTERRIELLGEGFRTSDIARTNQTFPAKGSVGAVAPSADQYIWPISIAELLVNKACQQNPGY